MPHHETPRAALEAARRVFALVVDAPDPPDAARIGAAWQAAEALLHSVTNAPKLHGQALVGEARRCELLSLTEAFPLVELHAFTDWRDDAITPDAARRVRAIARDALQSLARAVAQSEHSPIVTGPVRMESRPEADGATRPAAAQFEPNVRQLEQIAAPSSHRRMFRSAGWLLAVAMLLILGSVGAWMWSRSRESSPDFDEAVAAYRRGAREVARQSFAQAVRARPTDERPLIFLGRLAREEGNLPSARRFLDAAIRLAPESALATRELAAVLLADGQAELARRFYVRALQLDPTDRVAQGFLGCALFRLGRADEARRWTDRAGPGDWQPCISAPAASSSASPSK